MIDVYRICTFLREANEDDDGLGWYDTSPSVMVVDGVIIIQIQYYGDDGELYQIVRRYDEKDMVEDHMIRYNIQQICNELIEAMS
ncbi:hypothetical protein F485_gp008 [Aeromonas phage CC2]|uniref:Uncharacterized protein n=3 Tax=Ceceduovirus TaxID=2842588 RepID=A0A291LDK8_9CAUD|nr:hypothetical protein F485_gp008 [Aeromonas phage CC2]YP_009834332.1 hypothetical protein HWB28_gp032 [Aeromonas phage AS-zj]ATI17477.1 hypothetical protein [Aeromonas phage AS-szw]QAX99032.1 hypothetical protein assk_243 [Aeromonas phage Assk]UKM62545.1 hypothetical protein P19_0057 [Aeromonas phage P19]AFN39270.1 hypothetical protein CC2_258 [Aeromonas phage CC2]ASU00520.1 hypothetical protein [Aeromonas phage AS-zj]